MVYFALMEQTGSTVVLLTERTIDRNFFDLFEIPSSWFLSLNPLVIVFFGLVIAKLWSVWNPNATAKMALGVIAASLGMYCFSMAALTGSLWFIVLGYFVLSIGELAISPVAYSALSKVSPLDISGLVMGLFLLKSSFAYLIGAIIGALTDVDGVTSVQAEAYGSVFNQVGSYGLIIGVVALLLSPLAKKLLRV